VPADGVPAGRETCTICGGLRVSQIKTQARQCAVCGSRSLVCTIDSYTWSLLSPALHWLHLESTLTCTALATLTWSPLTCTALATLGVHSHLHCTGYTWSSLSPALHWLHLLGAYSHLHCTGYTWSPLSPALHWLHLELTHLHCTGYTWSPLTCTALWLHLEPTHLYRRMPPSCMVTLRTVCSHSPLALSPMLHP
jgi:hypothetical protein